MFISAFLVAGVIGGMIGYFWGVTRGRDQRNREWMRAMERARINGIIDVDQESHIIRIQGSDEE